jgi:hypothetical protein
MLTLVYTKDVEIKDTTFSASFLDIYLKCDTNRQLSTGIYDKRDDFNFAIINVLHLDSNYMSTASAYGVYISQLIRYARACSLNSDDLQRHHILSTKLLN